MEFVTNDLITTLSYPPAYNSPLLVVPFSTLHQRSAAGALHYVRSRITNPQNHRSFHSKIQLRSLLRPRLSMALIIPTQSKVQMYDEHLYK